MKISVWWIIPLIVTGYIIAMTQVAYQKTVDEFTTADDNHSIHRAFYKAPTCAKCHERGRR